MKMISGFSPNVIGLKHFLIGLNEIANPLLCCIPLRKYRKMADELPDDFDVIVLGTGMLCDYKLFHVVKLMKQFTSFGYLILQPQFQVELLRSDFSFIYFISRFSHFHREATTLGTYNPSLVSLKNTLIRTNVADICTLVNIADQTYFHSGI